MSLIERLESYRKKRSLSKTDMAKAFGVAWQNYHNWTARGSLPKEFYSAAFNILDISDIEGVAEDHPSYPHNTKDQLKLESAELSPEELSLLQDFAEFIIWKRSQG